MNLTRPQKVIFMASLLVLLTAVDGIEWRLSYKGNATYLAVINSGSFSLCSPHVTHIIGAGQKEFSLYFANAFINFPFSEFKKYKEFVQQVDAAKAAA